MKSLFLVAGLLLSMATYAQSHGSISGTITDTEMNGAPLMFANIELKGTHVSVQTNLNGNFEMGEIVPGNYILAIGFPGYETLEIPVEVEKNKIVEVRRELSAKSIDVGALLQAERVSKTKIPALISSRSR